MRRRKRKWKQYMNEREAMEKEAEAAKEGEKK